LHSLRSQLSFSFASASVCHCMFCGASRPQQDNGQMWSMTYPRHRPTDPWSRPPGQGFACLNSFLAVLLRLCPAPGQGAPASTVTRISAVIIPGPR
jgi:hypothetical protein